jgi:hypothetical protein
MTSTQPLLHCCDTWHVLAAAGAMIPNRPEQPETWAALRRIRDELLEPIEKRFGLAIVTYGFAGPELVRAVEKRARETGTLPNITPRGDQHAGHEKNSVGKRICERDGVAVDLQIPGVSSLAVASWVMENLPFDRIYLYGADRPFHISWAPAPLGQVIEMRNATSGAVYPHVVRRGRREPSET